MKYRNLEYILHTSEFIDLVEKYQLKHNIFENVLFVWNDNLILNVYGFTVEDIFYLEFFSSNLKYYATPSELLSIDGRSDRRKRYEEEKTTRKNVTGVNEEGNKEVLLKAEQFLFFFFKVFIDELGDYFMGRKKLTHQCHRSVEPHQQKRLNSFFTK